MRIVSTDSPTDEQFSVIARAASRFGCLSDFRIVESSPGLPDGWVLVFLGERKSFPHVMQVSPAGEVVVGAPSQEF